MYFGFVGFRNDCVDGTTQNCMRRYTIIWKECQTQLIIIMILVIVNGISFSCASWLTMTSFAKDVNLWLAKRPMVNNRRLANLELIYPRHLNCIFLNENMWFFIKISLNSVPDQATSHYLNQQCLVYWRIYASPGFNKCNVEFEWYFC